MTSKIFEVTTNDHIILPGIVYSGDKPSKSVAVYLHGTGGSSVFYKQTDNEIWAKELSKVGIDFATFNNRGGNIITRHKWLDETNEKQYAWAGCAFELMKDCVTDIDAVASYLKKQGYKTLYLVGHSTGANKIVLYDYLKSDNPFKAYGLLSGGDDTGLMHKELGGMKFNYLLRKAHHSVRGGRGMDLVNPRTLGGKVISWQSLLDMLDPEGDYNLFPFKEALTGKRLSTRTLFSEFSGITKPSIIIYGEDDEYCYERVSDCVDILKKAQNSKANMEYVILPEADHSYTGKVDTVAAKTAKFLETS